MQYVHHLNPFAIQFSETFGIRWYGLAYLAGFMAGYYSILALIRKGRVLMPEAQLSDYITYCAIGALAGGRIGYCLFYSPDLLTELNNEFPFWGVLKVHKGGMASHGGILGMIVASYLFGKKNKLPFFHLLDLNVLGGCLGIFFGRIANFINGELYGREAPSDLWWAVKFPQEMFLWGSGQLDKIAKLAEAARLSGVSTVEQWSGWVQNFNSDFKARSAIDFGIEKIIASTQNGNLMVVESLRPLLTPRYPSQLVQAVLEGLFVFLILLVIWRRPQKQGVVAAWFGFFYAVARIVGEQYRMPDVQLGYRALGLTRGQWLSVAMLVVAIAFVVWAYWHDSRKLGGFLPEKS